MVKLSNILLDSGPCDIVVEDGKFLRILPSASTEAPGYAAVPAFFNAHAHNAMSLVRGYADDIALESWLNDYIWPYEASLQPSDIRRGSEMAAREMVRTGSVAMNDMYFDIEETIGVVERTGLKALIGITVMENHSKAESERKKEFVREWKDPTGGRIKLAMAPHAVYTVGTEKLRWSAAFARENGLKIHMHLAETKTEVANCVRDFGLTPVRYLDSIGFLGPDVILAHCIYVDKEEWDILAERGVSVVHCPCSNMKISSGRFPYELALASGVNVALGTDGCCSNNNLDMREEMKFAALLAKVAGDPTLLPAPEVLKWATQNGARAMGFENSGRIEEGCDADFILLDLSAVPMQPLHNLVSNWVYAADPGCIAAVYCNGKKL